MHSSISRRVPFFDFVIQTEKSLAEVNATLRGYLMAKTPVVDKSGVWTRFYGRVTGATFVVRGNWLGTGCFGAGECRSNPEGTAVSVRVRWSYWWLAGAAIIYSLAPFGGRTVWNWWEWIISLVATGGLFWALQTLAGNSLVRFLKNLLA
jgi:hypothetical protein